MLGSVIITLCLLSAAIGQQIGTQQQEVHPQLTVQTCSNSSGCQTSNKPIVLDSNWRWVHRTQDTTNCYTGNKWDTTICPNPTTCAANCALEGVDYRATYAITTSGNSLNLGFVTKGPYATNIGSRVYLMQDDTNYQMLKLKNKEFTFDVDVSNLPCGLNGALYLAELPQDGGLAAHPGNKCGAKYGTGYCDAQCPHDIKFINGEANILNWNGSPNDPNAGTGSYGTCCTELDIWEANSMSSAYTPHPCSVTGQTRCNGTACGDDPNNRYGGVCDKDGCDFNSYRMGVKNFYGKGMTVDTSKPFTVVTQFITANKQDSGDLSEIRRVWVQGGKVIQNSKASFPTLTNYDSVTDAFCGAQKTLFGDQNSFSSKGGLRAVGQALQRGMVLVMSLWDDHTAYMLWLDSDYPLNKPNTTPGVSRGSCPTSSGRPDDVQNQFPNANVKFSNIKWGDIGSTFTGN